MPPAPGSDRAPKNIMRPDVKVKDALIICRDDRHLVRGEHIETHLVEIAERRFGEGGTLLRRSTAYRYIPKPPEQTEEGAEESSPTE